MADQDMDRGPDAGATGALSPANLLTPEASAIAGFAFAVFSMLGQGSWSIAITALFWGDSYPAGSVGGVMVGWGVGALLMAALGGWLASRALGVGTVGWDAHLARAAVLVAAVGALLSLLTIVGALLQ